MQINPYRDLASIRFAMKKHNVRSINADIPQEVAANSDRFSISFSGLARAAKEIVHS
jgi:hypothetical protein